MTVPSLTVPGWAVVPCEWLRCGAPGHRRWLPPGDVSVDLCDDHWHDFRFGGV